MLKKTGSGPLLRGAICVLTTREENLAHVLTTEIRRTETPFLGAAGPRRHAWAPECPELAAAPGCRLRPKPQTQLYLHFGLVFCVRDGVTLGVTVRRRRPGITACAPLLPLH